jgi:hypothetical protein
VRFLKVKYAKFKVTLEWEIKNKKGDWDQYSMACSDEPKPEFKAALVALDRDVVDMCELPVDYLTRIIVTSVSFSYGGEKEVLGATVTAQMHLNKSNVALNLNTPHKVEEFYADDGDPKQLLTDGCIERLGDLTTQAEAYVNGDRAQGELFPTPEEVKEEGMREIAQEFHDNTKKGLGPGESVTISAGGHSATIKGEGRA